MKKHMPKIVGAVLLAVLTAAGLYFCGLSWVLGLVGDNLLPGIWDCPG